MEINGVIHTKCLEQHLAPKKHHQITVTCCFYSMGQTGSQPEENFVKKDHSELAWMNHESI